MQNQPSLANLVTHCWLMEQTEDHIACLPLELLHLVLWQLPSSQLCVVSEVSWYLYGVLDDNLWKSMIHRQYVALHCVIKKECGDRCHTRAMCDSGWRYDDCDVDGDGVCGGHSDYDVDSCDDGVAVMLMSLLMMSVLVMARGQLQFTVLI